MIWVSIFDRFGLRFGNQVGTMLPTKTPPRRPTKLSRRPQDTKTPSRGPKMPPRPPKISPRPLKTVPGSAQEPPEVLINWRGGTKAQPSTIRRPTGSACGIRFRGLLILLYISFRILLLRGSCLPPPKSSPSSLGPTPAAAAICGAGASWRLLGRKNRVPRGLQKLIKF